MRKWLNEFFGRKGLNDCMILDRKSCIHSVNKNSISKIYLLLIKFRTLLIAIIECFNLLKKQECRIWVNFNVSVFSKWNKCYQETQLNVDSIPF